MGRSNLNELATAINTRRAVKESRKQTALLKQLAAQQAPVAASAGWYPCTGDPLGSVRYWDGQQWTAHFRA